MTQSAWVKAASIWTASGEVVPWTLARAGRTWPAGHMRLIAGVFLSRTGDDIDGIDAIWPTPSSRFSSRFAERDAMLRRASGPHCDGRPHLDQVSSAAKILLGANCVEVADRPAGAP